MVLGLARDTRSEDAQVLWSAYSLLSHTHGSVAANSKNIGLCIRFALRGSLNPGMKNQGIWRVDCRVIEENTHVSGPWNSKLCCSEIIFVSTNGAISCIFMAE